MPDMVEIDKKIEAAANAFIETSKKATEKWSAEISEIAENHGDQVPEHMLVGCVEHHSLRMVREIEAHAEDFWR